MAELEPISIQQLVRASGNANALDVFVNANASTIVFRPAAEPIETLEYWRNYMSALATGKNGVDGIDAAITSMTVATGAAGTQASVVTGGTPTARTFALTIPRGDKGLDGSFTQKSYTTYAAMDADKVNIPANTSVTITNDTDTTKNGMYAYNGTSFTKSAYDPVALAATDATTKANNAKTQAVADSKTYTDAELLKAVNKSSGTFDTLALLTASALVNDSYALVANDTDLTNNGHYQKKAGVWSLIDLSVSTNQLIQEYNDKALTKTVYQTTDAAVPTKAILGEITATIEYDAGNAVTALHMDKASFITEFAINLQTYTGSDANIQIYTPNKSGYTLKYTKNVGVILNKLNNVLAEPLYLAAGEIFAVQVAGRKMQRANPLAYDTISNSVIRLTTIPTTVGQAVVVSRTALSLPEIVLTTYPILTEYTAVENLDFLALLANKAVTPLSHIAGDFLVSNPTLGVATLAIGIAQPTAKTGRLKTLKFMTGEKSGFVDVTFFYLTEQVTGHKVEKVVSLRVATDADKIAVITPKDIGMHIIKKGSYVAISGITSRDGVQGDSTNSGSNAGSWLSMPIASLVLNDVVPITINASNGKRSIQVEYEYFDVDITDRSVDPTTQASTGKNTLIDTRFTGTTIPATWTAAGTWTFADGAKSPATGNWATRLLSTGYSALAKRTYFTRIKVVDASSVFGICTMPIEPSSGSAVAMVNGVTKKIIVYNWDGSTNAGTEIVSKDIPTLVANRDYLLEVTKNGWFSTVTLTDTISLVKVVLEHKGFVDYTQFHGQAGVMFISGNITVNQFRFTGLYPKKVRAILIGDSNAERAVNVLPNTAWSYQLADLRASEGDVVVAARSGDETPNFEKRKDYDLKAWTPEYVILGLGTNDTDLAYWRSKIALLISEVEALGGEPILVTYPPRNALQASMTTDVLGKYFGNYRYIDIASALTLNNDRATWNPTYNSGDNLHMNTLGHERVVEQVKADVPDLLL